jgi:hypothetical protein
MKIAEDDWKRLEEEVKKLGTMVKDEGDDEAWKLVDGSYVFLNRSGHDIKMVPFNTKTVACEVLDVFFKTVAKKWYSYQCRKVNDDEPAWNGFQFFHAVYGYDY